MAAKRKRGLEKKHAEPVTRTTHCPRGHEWTEESTGRGVNGYRACLICRKERVGGKESVQCVSCHVFYILSGRNARRSRSGEVVPLCPICRSLPEIVVEDEHREFWLNGGKDGLLRWEDLMSLAAGVELWFGGAV